MYKAFMRFVEFPPLMGKSLAMKPIDQCSNGGGEPLSIKGTTQYASAANDANLCVKINVQELQPR
jgi:hypothetical protein